MREAIENVSLLQKQINDLQIENRMLKEILNRAGIPYAQELTSLCLPEEAAAFDPEQGARIIHPDNITEKMANLFYSWFWGRQDVYAKRSVKKATGEAGYYPQCRNFWTNVCPRKRGQKISCKDCSYQAHKTLRKEDILRHLEGNAPDASDVIGVYPLLPNGTCRFLVYDFDNHERDAEKRDFANTDDSWIEEVDALRTICTLNGIDPLVERSRSGRGAHVWLFFDRPLPAALVRKFGAALLAKGAEQVNLKSFKYYDRMLPAQDTLPANGIGNLIALPLQGRALLEGNSAFVDRSWNAYPDQWAALQCKPKMSREFVELKLAEWAPAAMLLEGAGAYPEEESRLASEREDPTAEKTKKEPASKAAGTNQGKSEREKPWKAGYQFSASDADGTMHITLSNGIYVDSLNLKPALQNRIRRMAAFGNPVYYRNNAIGTSNFETPRWIYLGKDHPSGYIQIPRGLYEGLIENMNAAAISYEIDDERQYGRQIDVSFKGELREEQKPALEQMLRYDNGILHAATAFGKTVVCSAMIAERKTSTLIILESSALIEQWKDALDRFLEIKEELPEYKTKTGRVKKRKSLVGLLQSQHDSTTGIIDIAMAGSLCKKGEYHHRLDQYGMVIVDECHHAASGHGDEGL